MTCNDARPIINTYKHILLSKKVKVAHTRVGFVAAAVSMPIGGCRARRSLVVDVDVSVATEPAVL